MNNKMMRLIEEQIGYTFQNRDLLQQAFVRRSYAKENGGGDNEILEFIGDKALDVVVVKLLSELYGRYAKEDGDFVPSRDCNEFRSKYREGQLTELKIKLVQQKTLASCMDRLDFAKYLIMGKGDEKNHAEAEDSVKEDLFEAIIGAVALDCDWDLKQIGEVVEVMLQPEQVLEKGSDNDISLVQEWCSKKYGVMPVYTFHDPCHTVIALHWNGEQRYIRGSHPVVSSPMNQLNNEHRRELECRLTMGNMREIFVGYGYSKTEARKAVARLAYDYLDEHDLLFLPIDEIGAPDVNRAINQLQELYQKGYIGEPRYDFFEAHDENGAPMWHCECHVAGRETYWWGNYASKKQGKKNVAYDMLCDILGWER